jgi:beta-lactam-binding protein with PASTA domain/tRNA A-37 threonylcarbamoyl transferase component Bud32
MPEIDENVLIDGRYRVLRHVGSGGMADVYCAEDLHLGRNVALKLLYRRFAQDEQFVERFKREASAAAALQHPNVVSVYDRGKYDGTYYIAMEFCEGPSLKELITREAPLEMERAVDLAKKILIAARFAHRRGVIHRDLKPQNVIIEPDEGGDSVKVADFGIARAGASEITEVGAIMGTAHYLSPEQAQGHSVNEATDLYSIGVVLFEMLTGRTPFQGDSAVAIALRHVSQPAPSPREFRPEIPPELEAVVLKALAKDPKQRYLDADSFIADLDAARSALDGDRHVDLERTAKFDSVKPGDLLPVPVAVAAPPGKLAPAEPGGAPPPPPDDRVHPRRRPGRRPLALGALLLLAIVAAGYGAYTLLRPNQVRVPLVLGQTITSARDDLQAAGFKVDIDRRPDPAPADTVFRQVPGSGEDVDEGSTVTLFVSAGPSNVKVPDVIGLGEQDAKSRIRRADLRPTVEEESSIKVPAGNVIRSDPGPRVSIERGSRVVLAVSTGPKHVQVPDLLGLDEDAAVARLREQGLNVVVRERGSSEPSGTVVSQLPAAGQDVDEGSSVTLYVSNGNLAKVPDVTGFSQARAEADIRDAGFTPLVRMQSVSEPDRDGRVISQTPPGGKEKRKGNSVVITVGQLVTPPPETPTTPSP